MVVHTLRVAGDAFPSKQREVPVHSAVVSLTRLLQQLRCSFEEVDQRRLVVLAHKKGETKEHRYEWTEEQALALAVFGLCWIQAAYEESLSRVLWAGRELLKLLPPDDKKLRLHATSLRLSIGDSEMNPQALPIQCAYVAARVVPTAARVKEARSNMGLFSAEMARLLAGKSLPGAVN